MTELRFVLIAGMPGAGKSLLAQVARELGLPVYTMGDVVREEVRKLGLEPTPQNMNIVAKKLREQYGKDVVARRTLARILNDGVQGVVVVDGVRSLDEVRVFQERGKTVIIAVHASPRTRFERMKRRGRPGDPKSWEEFRKRDETELKFGIGDVIALADYMVVNEGLSVNEFREKARKLLEDVIRELSSEK